MSTTATAITTSAMPKISAKSRFRGFGVPADLGAGRFVLALLAGFPFRACGLTGGAA